MRCQCGSKTNVLDSRLQDDGGMWRKRRCPACSKVFTTTEVVCITLPGMQGRPPNSHEPNKDKHVSMRTKRLVVPDVKPVQRPKHARSNSKKTAAPKSKKIVPTVIPKNRKEIAEQIAQSPEPRQIAARNRIEDLRNERLLNEL